MQNEKHVAALQEVETTIREALESSQGLLAHQRRLMLMLSLGVQHSIELYLHKKAALKPGAQVKHEWFKLSDRNIQQRLQPNLTKPWSELGLIEICSLAQDIETERNDIVYGAPLPNDVKLRNLVGKFLELTALIEKEVGRST